MAGTPVRVRRWGRVPAKAKRPIGRPAGSNPVPCTTGRVDGCGSSAPGRRLSGSATRRVSGAVPRGLTGWQLQCQRLHLKRAARHTEHHAWRSGSALRATWGVRVRVPSRGRSSALGRETSCRIRQTHDEAEVRLCVDRFQQMPKRVSVEHPAASNFKAGALFRRRRYKLTERSSYSAQGGHPPSACIDRGCTPRTRNTEGGTGAVAACWRGGTCAGIRA